MKKSNESTSMRIDNDFIEDLFDIKTDTEKKLKKDVSIREVTEGMRKTSSFQKLKEETIKFLTDERGSGWDYIILAITAIFLAVFFIFYSFAFHTGYTDIMNGLSSNPSFILNNQTVNVSQAFTQTFGQVDTAYQSLQWLGVLMIFCSFMAIFVSNIYVKDYPITFLIYVCFIVITVVVAVQISNAYNLAISSPQIADYANNFIGINWILINLPIILTIIGFIGGTILIINIINPQ